MNQRISIKITYILACLVLSFCGVSHAAGGVGDFVEITLRDGSTVRGIVLEETDYKFVVETKLAKITFKKTVAKSDAKRVEVITAALDRELDANHNNERPANLPVRDDARHASETARGGFVVFPVTGAFGEEVSASYFSDALERAQGKGAELVVFHLDSPGGYVSALTKIRAVLDDYEDEMLIAFYVNSECFSAAAMLAMSAEYMYIGSGARFGAAVGYSWNDSGSATVDAKFNSALAATWRSHAEQYGRPGILIDAMILPETEIYADTSESPWRLYPAKPEDMHELRADGEPRFVLVDSSKSILSLTHNEAVNLGVVNGSVGSAREVVDAIGIESPDREVFDGTKHWNQYTRRYRTNIKATDRAIESFVDAASLIEGESTIYGVRSKVRAMIGNLKKASRLAQQYDYVRLHLAGQGISPTDIDRTVTKLNRVLANLNKR